MFMLPFNIMTYLPNLFFGALVMWIGQDIMKASGCRALARTRAVCVSV